MTIQFDRRRTLGQLSSFALTLNLGLPARAQSRLNAARILCGYPPGGSVDLTARKLAESITGRYAASVLVDNKPGAAGRLAVEELKRAPADGSTLLLTPASILTMYPHTFRSLSYDVFADLVPVSTIATTGFALAVGPKVPASAGSSFEAFVQWCKSEPGNMQIGNAGAGSMPHFLAMMLARELAVEAVHVPYRGGLATMQAVAGGEVAAAIATESSARALQQIGKLRVLATAWPDKSPVFPTARSFAQLGLAGLTQTEWFGIFAPARTPETTVRALSESIGVSMQSSEVAAIWEKLGLVIDTCTPAELQASVRREYQRWGPIVKSSGFTPEA